MDAVFDAVAGKLLQPDSSSTPIGTQILGGWRDMAMLKQPRENAQNISHFVDIIEHVAGPFDYDALSKSIQNEDRDKVTAPQPGDVPPPNDTVSQISRQMSHLQQLQIPIRMKELTKKPASVQLAIIPENGSSPPLYTIFKHFMIKSKVDHRQMEGISHGQLRVIDWGESPSETRKLFQLQFEQLGGFQLRLWKLHCPDASGGFNSGSASSGQRGCDRKGVTLTDEQIDRGYDYIKDYAPRNPTNNAIPRWIKKCKQDPMNPIYYFTVTEIKEGMQNNKNEGDHASIVTKHPLTLMDLAPWVRKIMKKVIKKVHLQHSLVLLGEKKVGKTAMGESFAMSTSRYRVRGSKRDIEPGYRLTQDLDFLKDIEGEVEIPLVLDDCDSWELTAKAVLAYLDVKAKEAKTRERWTSTKMKGTQLRILCDNPYDETVEIKLPVTEKMFFDLVRPAFHPKMTAGKIEAALTRAVTMVNTKTHLVVKFGEDADIFCMDWPFGETYLASDAPAKLKEFSVAKCLPEDYDEKVAQEQAFMTDLLEGIH